MNFADIQALDHRLRTRVAGERTSLVAFLRDLDAFDREQAYAELNCGSTFDYLVRKLHLPEGTAFARVTAMKLGRRFPELEAALEDGRLNTTQLLVLQPVLTPENVDDLVRRATHLTKRRTEELVVAIRPKAVLAPGLRKLPDPSPRPVTVPAPTADDVTEVTHLDVGLRIPGSSSAPGNPEDAPASLAVPSLTLAPAPRPEPRSRLEPVAAERWQWRHVLDGPRKEKLERLRGYLSHKIPDGDLDKVFDQMLDDSLEKHGKRLGYVEPERPRAAKEKPATPGVRARVPLPVRRAVLKRDGYRCTSVSADGERCPATEHLEMDHIEGARVTGSSREEDLTTRCRLHNHYRARQRYGAEYVRRRIEEERRAREARRAVRARTEQGTLCEPVAAYLTRQRLAPESLAAARAAPEEKGQIPWEERPT